MISDDKITDIFFQIDEFMKVFEPALRQNLISQGKRLEIDLVGCLAVR